MVTGNLFRGMDFVTAVNLPLAIRSASNFPRMKIAPVFHRDGPRFATHRHPVRALIREFACTETRSRAQNEIHSAVDIRRGRDTTPPLRRSRLDGKSYIYVMPGILCGTYYRFVMPAHVVCVCGMQVRAPRVRERRVHVG